MSTPRRCPLTARDALAIAEILRVTLAGAHVARAVGGDVIEGTARSLVHSALNPTSLGPLDDIRDAYLRVTLDGGADAFWPVAELVDEQPAGAFAEYSR